MPADMELLHGAFMLLEKTPILLQAHHDTAQFSNSAAPLTKFKEACSSADSQQAGGNSFSEVAADLPPQKHEAHGHLNSFSANKLDTLLSCSRCQLNTSSSSKLSRSSPVGDKSLCLNSHHFYWFSSLGFLSLLHMRLTFIYTLPPVTGRSLNKAPPL